MHTEPKHERLLKSYTGRAQRRQGHVVTAHYLAQCWTSLPPWSVTAKDITEVAGPLDAVQGQTAQAAHLERIPLWDRPTLVTA